MSSALSVFADATDPQCGEFSTVPLAQFDGLMKAVPAMSHRVKSLFVHRFELRVQQLAIFFNVTFVHRFAFFLGGHHGASVCWTVE